MAKTEHPHTPGTLHRNIRPASKYNTLWAGRNVHVAHLATRGKADGEIEANADRIVAAWNACDGVSTAALENGYVEKMREQLEYVLAWFQKHDPMHPFVATIGAVLAAAKAGDCST